MKTLVLLSNIGSPKSANPVDVRAYLEEFLMDPKVITLPYLLRWILVKLIIGPLRSKKSSLKYKSIWTDQGSPLLQNTNQFIEKLQSKLGSDYLVKVGYRYGQDRIDDVLQSVDWNLINKIIFIPMYPQFAQATTQTSKDFFYHTINLLVSKKVINPLHLEIKTIDSFYKKDSFIKAWVDNINYQLNIFNKNKFSESSPNLTNKNIHYLFSFHGLPEKQITSQTGCELNQNCCSQAIIDNKNCYRAHCIYTANEIAKKMNLSKDEFSISFQSRLGQAKWLQPYTSEIIKQLYEKKINHLTVISPAFVADCLETIEELGVELKEDFLHLDSQNTFHLISSLNDFEPWVDSFAMMCKDL